MTSQQVDSWFLLKACILVKTDTGKHAAVSKKLAQFPGVRMCFPVLGQADVVLKIEVKDTGELARAVREILLLRGVSDTETLVESEAG